MRHKFKEVIDEHPFNQNYHITAKQIGDFLEGGAGLGRRLFWRSLVTGQIDADRADYLLRDAYHIGTNYGSYDLRRLLVTLTIAEHPETGAPMIAVEDGGLHAAEALIIARYMMFTQVYFHHTRRAYDHHFARAMKSLMHDVVGRETFLPPTTPENIDDYINWDDWRVLGLLSQGIGGKDGYALKERKHHRCVFYTSEVPTEAELDRSNEALIRLSKFEPFVDEPKKSWYSEGESDIMVERDLTPDLKETVPLSSFSSVVKGLLPIRQRRIYVPLEGQEEAILMLNRKEG